MKVNDPMPTPNILELLRFTEAHNRHAETLTRATGEHFNIFNILGIGRREVTTHSPMLSELLNPKGTHGQGSIFLQLFLKEFAIQDFDAKGATLEMEYSVGPVKDESGGRIDILLRAGKSTIVIENKIDAEDQPEQMKRYRNEFPKAHLFYLTLLGSKPSNLLETELEQIDCSLISYEKHILGWLKDCRKEAVSLPVVRETISQYVHLIEELTNQSTTIVMSKELIDYITSPNNPESLRAFYKLLNANVAVHTQLISQLDAKLDDLAKANQLNLQRPIQELSQKYHGFFFTTPELDNRNLLIGFVFESNGYRDFFFGFGLKDFGKPCPAAAKISAEFGKHFHGESPTEHWAAWAWWREHQNWEYETFEAIRSGQFAEDLNEKLKKMANIARKVCTDEAAI